MSTTIQETIQEILSDIKIFPIGFSSNFSKIREIVLMVIRQKYPEFINIPDNDIAHHLAKLLEVHSNHRDNAYYEQYCNTRTRDISKVKISSTRYKYTFGTFLL